MAALSPCRGNDVSWVQTGSGLVALPVLAGLELNRSSVLTEGLAGYMRTKLTPIARGDEGGHEVVLDVERREMRVRVVRNETLVKQLRMERHSANKPNILVILLDAVSRPQLKRKLPKLFDFLSRMDESHSAHVMSFRLFNPLAHYTAPNLWAMDYGLSADDAKNIQRRPMDYPAPLHYSSAASANGYVTGYSATACQISDFDTREWWPMGVGRFDHMMVHCDPNFLHPTNPWDLFKGPYSMLKRCVYGRGVHEHSLEYLTSFFAAYPDVPKLFKLVLLEGHEPTAEVIGQVDADLARALGDLWGRHVGHAQDTVVVLASDHGNHMHGLFRLFSTEAAEVEMSTPLLTLITPRRYVNQSRVARVNSNRLVTMFDVHATIMQLIDESLPESRRGKDLLRSEVSQWRSCEEADIPDSECNCIS